MSHETAITVFYILQASFSIFVVGGTIYYFYLFFLKPREFYWGPPNDLYGRLFYMIAYSLAAFIGIYIAVYRGLESAASWLPEGERNPGASVGTKGIILLLAAFWMTYAIFIGMKALAGRVAHSEDALRQATARDDRRGR